MATVRLRDAFYDLIARSREYEIHVATVENVRTATREFENAVNAMPDGDMAEAFHIVGENPGESQRLKENLRRMHDPEIQRFCNVVIVNRLLVPRRGTSHATRVFEAFIQGITHFENKNAGIRDAQPAYHRLFSCGPGDTSFRNLFQRCAVDMSRVDRLDVRKRIETCYIERMIYDDIYGKVSLHFPAAPFDDNTQDVAHEQRMTVTREDFRTCYPDIDIKINMDYEADMPFLVRVTRITRGKVTSTEEFKRSFWMDGAYDAVVECTRSTELRTWHKGQTYAREVPWKQRLREVQVNPFPPPLTPHVSPFTNFEQ